MLLLPNTEETVLLNSSRKSLGDVFTERTWKGEIVRGQGGSVDAALHGYCMLLIDGHDAEAILKGMEHETIGRIRIETDVKKTKK
jgi:hypothetical protein